MVEGLAGSRESDHQTTNRQSSIKQSPIANHRGRHCQNRQSHCQSRIALPIANRIANRQSALPIANLHCQSPICIANRQSTLPIVRSAIVNRQLVLPPSSPPQGGIPSMSSIVGATSRSEPSLRRASRGRCQSIRTTGTGSTCERYAALQLVVPHLFRVTVVGRHDRDPTGGAQRGHDSS